MFHSVVPYIRLRARIVAVVVNVWIAGGEDRRVEPRSQLLIQRARGQMRRPGSCRAGTTRIGDTGAAECTRAPADNDGEAALEGDDGVDPPSADERIGNSVQVIQKLLTP